MCFSCYVQKYNKLSRFHNGKCILLIKNITTDFSVMMYKISAVN